MRKKDIQKYINRYIYDGKSGGFIYHDIQKSIGQGLNYLTALGLMAYTEFLGSLFPRLSPFPIPEAEKGRNRINFYNCFYRMGQDYVRFDQYLRENFKKGVYGIYRGGLVHAYFVGGNVKVGKTRLNLSSIVATTSNRSLGISGGFKLAIATKNYFNDLMSVVRAFRRKVLEEKDNEWVEAFLKGSGLDKHFLE